MTETIAAPSNNRPAADDPAKPFIGGNSEMSGRVRTFDWSATSLGPAALWPVSLKTVVRLMMSAAQPMVLWWGNDLVQMYNDAFVPSFGVGKHPEALGRMAPDCWRENWTIIGPQIQRVREGGPAELYRDNLVPIFRNGVVEECYWSYSFTPVFDEENQIAGVLTVCTETTQNVLAQRRRRALEILSQGAACCDTPEKIWALVQSAAAATPNDITTISAGRDAAAGPATVSISAAEVNLTVDLVINFGISASLPFDPAYRQFLEQFTAVTGAAHARIESAAARAIVTAERDRLLLDAPVGAAVMIGEDLVYHLVNAVYAMVCGRPASSMVGKPFAEVFPELVGSAVERQFRAVYQAGTPYVSEETLVPIHRNGGVLEDRYFTYNLSPLRRLDGSVYGLMVIAVDLTQQVRARGEIERLNHDLNASARAKDEFLALLGHELRNPLAPIVTALELMKLRKTSTEREQAVIRRQVDHLVRLVDDLLDVSRITRGKVELRKTTVDVRTVLGKAVEMVSPMLEQKRQLLSVDVPSMAWHGDPARLAQVVSNLLTNGSRYTPEGGRISLTAALRQDRVLIEVADNGMGIPPKLQPFIFDPFVQGVRRLDKSAGGLGIGLALVKNLVERHEGQVSVHSEGPGKGCVFSIDMPQGDILPPEKDAKLEASTGWPQGHAALRILVVDDNEDAADLLADSLRSLGHHVRVAYDPPQALQEYARAAPDVAILDIGLPGISGYELAERLRQHPQNETPRFIALTGYGQAKDLALSRSAGFEAHLVKPVNLEQLRLILDGRVTLG